MTPGNLFRKSLLAFLVLWGQHALAGPEADWLSGTRAFEQADFSDALQYFQAAKDAGQSGPAVHYNIAVCEYKLGRYVEARTSFASLGAEYQKMRPLAEYNLGLVEIKLHHNDAARQHFLEAYRLSEDDTTLRILSSNKLAETEGTADVSNTWVGSFGLRAGYDDNIALRDDLGLPAGTTTDSPMVDFFGSLQGPFSGQNGFNLDASAYVVRYLDSDEFDQSVVRIGANYDWGFRQWSTKFGLHGSYGTLGGEGFDETGSASILIVRRLSTESSFTLRYQYDDIKASDILFSGIEGSRQKIAVQYRWYSNEQFLVIGYQLESNDRNDPGVSPQRNRLSIDYRHPLASGWGFELGGEYRDSDYGDLAIPRTEELTTLRAGLSKTLPADWQLLAQIQYSDNDSNDEVFSYDRMQVTVGVLKVF